MIEDTHSESETWVLRLLAGAVVGLFLTWLMSRMKNLESAQSTDRKDFNAAVERISVLEVEVKSLSESENKNSQAIVKIVESATRIEAALLGFGGKGGLIDTIEKLAIKVEELNNRRPTDD